MNVLERFQEVAEVLEGKFGPLALFALILTRDMHDVISTTSDEGTGPTADRWAVIVAAPGLGSRLAEIKKLTAAIGATTAGEQLLVRNISRVVIVPPPSKDLIAVLRDAEAGWGQMVVTKTVLAPMMVNLSDDDQQWLGSLGDVLRVRVLKASDQQSSSNQVKG